MLIYARRQWREVAGKAVIGSKSNAHLPMLLTLDTEDQKSNVTLLHVTHGPVLLSRLIKIRYASTKILIHGIWFLHVKCNLYEPGNMQKLVAAYYITKRIRYRSCDVALEGLGDKKSATFKFIMEFFTR